MNDETRVDPDEDGNCPEGFHKMPADDDHDAPWCMEGEEHLEETYNAQRNVPATVDSPMADPDRPWDGDSAKQRVRAWAGGEKENIDWDKYAKAFAYFDGEDREDFGAYKLPHHDIISGTLKVVLRGVQSANGVMQGAMGGVDLPSDQRSKVQAHLDYHLKQFGKEVNSMIETKETRTSTDIHFAEVRDENTEETKPKIVGYPVVFDSLSSDLGGFREKIGHGAFAESLQNNDEVHALFNHDDDKILGRRGAGTLKLWEDDHGLRMELDPPNTTVGNDVVELLRRGDLVSMSFGFYDVTDSWAMLDGTDVRTINSARLFDVSIVTNPAYEATSVDVRTAPALRSLEAHKAQEIIDNTDFAAIGEITKLHFRLRLAEQDQ